MQIRYYFSGFNPEKGFPQDLIEYFKLDIKSLDKLVFIPTDFSKKEKIEKYSKGFNESFNKAGFNFKNIVVLNENMTKEEMHSHIKNAKVIFLMGGNPSSQLDIIELYDLEYAIKSTDSIIMGISAGAMCMSKYSLLLPVNEEYSIIDIRKAMNLSNISIYPHYNSNGEIPEVFDGGTEKTKKSDLLYANKNYGDIYLLQDNAEIREQNGKLDFIGNNIILVSNGSFKIINAKEIDKE